MHKTLRRGPGRLLNVLCTFNLRPVFRWYCIKRSIAFRWRPLCFKNIFMLHFHFVVNPFRAFIKSGCLAFLGKKELKIHRNVRLCSLFLSVSKSGAVNSLIFNCSIQNKNSQRNFRVVIWSSLSQIFYKIGVLKNFAKFTERILYRSILLDEVADFFRIRLMNFLWLLWNF